MYARAIRRHWLVIALVTFAAVGASIAWLVLRAPEYEARPRCWSRRFRRTRRPSSACPLLRDSGSDTSRGAGDGGDAAALPGCGGADRPADGLGLGRASECWTASRSTPRARAASSWCWAARTKPARQPSWRTSMPRPRCGRARMRAAAPDRRDARRLRARRAELARTDDALAADLALAPDQRARVGSRKRETRRSPWPARRACRRRAPALQRSDRSWTLSLIAGLTLGIAGAPCCSRCSTARCGTRTRRWSSYDLPVLARIPLPEPTPGQRASRDGGDSCPSSSRRRSAPCSPS